MSLYDDHDGSWFYWLLDALVWWPSGNRRDPDGGMKFGILPYLFLAGSGYWLYYSSQNAFWVILFGLLIVVQVIFDFILPEDSEIVKSFQTAEYVIIVLAIVAGLITALVKYWPSLVG